MISIVIPCYNEAVRLDVEAYLSFLKAHSGIRLIFVNDGSTDATKTVLASIEEGASGRAMLIHSEENRGKAEAVRLGIRAGLREPVRFVGYWDADLATPLSEIKRFIEIAENRQEVRLVCGCRLQRLGAKITRHWYRHYPGRVVATCISLILGLRVYDTQCGAKLIDRDIAEKIFAEPFSSRWLFDVELFARVISLVGRREAIRIIYEYPLPRWKDVDKSRISAGDLPRIPLDLARIYARYSRQFKP